MNVLVVVPRLPGTGHTGDRVRTELHLEALATLGARVTLVGGMPSGAPVPSVPGAAEVRGVPMRTALLPFFLAKAALRGWPLQSALCDGPWEEAVAGLGPFDLAIVLLARLHPRVAPLLPDAPLVVDYVDALSEAARQNAERDPALWRRLYWRLEAPRLARAEREAARTAALLLATTPFDAGALPEGTAAIAIGAHLGPPPPRERPPVVVFTGRMGYRPNAVAAELLLREIWPGVRARVPRAELVVGGADAPRSLRRLASATVGARLVSPVSDMRALLSEARVAAVPVDMGTGTPIKVYEALEAGCAVVATPAAASRAVLDGVAAPVRTADGPAAFARELAALLSDEGAAAALGDRGRAFVVAHADRRVLGLRLAGLLCGAGKGS
ncbi:MAG: glycosyltransferase [Holophagales bacterium]|nr:glycosyltransferase [Holophagales bacterium]